MIAAAVHLVACMVVFSIVERLWPSSSPRKWWHRPLLMDICSWLILPLAVGAGITLAVLFTDALPREHFWNWPGRLRIVIERIPLFMQIVAAFIAIDFLSYWIHRAYHRIPFLWSFHIMHHTSEHVDWLSTLRLHPISQMIDTALIAGLLLVAAVPLRAIIAANAIVGFAAVLTHADVPWTFGAFGRLFVSPVFHHWHHARHESNSAQAANYGAALSIVWNVIASCGPAGSIWNCGRASAELLEFVSSSAVPLFAQLSCQNHCQDRAKTGRGPPHSTTLTRYCVWY